MATAPRVQKPSFWVLGLTSAITPTITNDFRWNYSRNFWQWFLTGGDAPQLPGLGGAVEIGGESTNALIPYNVNTQNTRTRYWDGKDNLIKDDVTIIKGNHLIQVGGSYQRNYDEHSRTDNGQGINNSLTYQVTSSNINFGNFAYPTGVPDQPAEQLQHLLLLRAGHGEPVAVGLHAHRRQPGARADRLQRRGQSIIPYYNIYFADTWHVKPSVTLSYGLSYQLEMPPHEAERQAGHDWSTRTARPVVAADYMAQRQKAALAGSVYNPILGFATRQQRRRRPQVPVRSLLRRLQPALLGGLESQVQRWHPGQAARQQRHRIARRLRPPLRPPERRQPGAGAAAAAGPAAGRILHRRQPDRRQCLGSNGVDPSTAFRIGPDGLARSAAQRFPDAEPALSFRASAATPARPTSRRSIPSTGRNAPTT